jgi:hypothetical protein
LLDQALTLIEQERWNDAKALLEQASKLAPFPNILFHLARVHYRLGERDQARVRLSDFEKLAGPTNPNYGDAQRLHVLLTQQSVASAPPTDAPLVTDTQSPRVQPAQRQFPLGPVVTAASGAALLVAAITTGLLSNAAKGELDRHCRTDGSCDSSLAMIKDRGQRFQLATNLLLGAGVAAIGAGTLWWFLTQPKTEEKLQVNVTLSHRGGSAAVLVGF